jgi:hypothetical protein
VRTDGADRVDDPWEQRGFSASRSDPDVDEGLEAALLSYKQRKAARWGAERFAAEFRRRDEAESQRPVWTSDALTAPVEASVESQVVEGEPATFREEPARLGFDESFFVSAPAPPLAEVVRPAEPPPEPAPIVPEPITFEPDPIQREEVPVWVTWQAPEVVPEPEPDVVPEPEPLPMRHPHVPRPPAPVAERSPEPRRRAWRGKRGQPEPVRASVISAPEWARMSPGARRLYGLEEPPGARRAG